MVFDKIKEMLSGTIAENIPDVSGITEQFASIGEQVSGIGEQASGLAEGAVTDVTDTVSQEIDNINPLN